MFPNAWRSSTVVASLILLVGSLLWDWRDAAHGGSALPGGSYDIGPGDPALLFAKG